MSLEQEAGGSEGGGEGKVKETQEQEGKEGEIEAIKAIQIGLDGFS